MRVFLIVLDSFGIGEAPDAAAFGDEGANTLAAVAAHPNFDCPQMTRLGLFHIDGTGRTPFSAPRGSFARLQEVSAGKDTTVGHWEIAGLRSEQPLPTFSNGFPQEFLDEFSRRTGRSVLCNLPYSGTKALDDYGEEALKTGAWIVYTSADSVFQLAANEDYIPLEELYAACETAREMLTGPLGVGRVIARPFVGEKAGGFTRTAHRHDYSIDPLGKTMLTALQNAGKDVISVGKIADIFNGVGITKSCHAPTNAEGMAAALELQKQPFDGLCFVNLVEFDSAYGHRRDVPGYAAALTEFDRFLEKFLPGMEENDVLMITADHGCDPAFTKTTDHTREYVPWLITGAGVKNGVNLGTRTGFDTIAATVCEALGVPADFAAGSVWGKVKN
ncbi:MAG: phosphopentomutase [Clostridia bacterium]|nr:phosphopentomutase [Clostridia bacterium]